MSKIIYEQSKGEFKRYQAIKCFTCKTFLGSKSELKKHKGHSVHYATKSGEIDE